MSLNDESGTGDIIEQGDGSRSHRLGFEAPRWAGFLWRGFGAGGGDDNPGWRPSRGAAVFAAVTLLAGLAAGYAAGRGTNGGAAPAPRSTTATGRPSGAIAPSMPVPASPLADVGPAVDQLTESCSAQSGSTLQLGIDVSNTSSATVTLIGLAPVFPGDLGGLREISRQWGACGELISGPRPSTVSLSPGQSTWLTATFKVLVHCPSPYPVQFDVKYAVGGRRVTAALPGFSDLSQVRYSGCPSPSGSSESSSTFSAIFLSPVGSPLTVHTVHR